MKTLIFFLLLCLLNLTGCDKSVFNEGTNTGEVGNASPAVGEVDYEIDLPIEGRNSIGDVNAFFNIFDYLTGVKEIVYYEVIDPDNCPILAKKISISYNYPLKKDKLKILFFKYSKDEENCSREPDRIFSGEFTFNPICSNLDILTNTENCIEKRINALLIGINLDYASNGLSLISDTGSLLPQIIKHFKLRWFIPFKK